MCHLPSEEQVRLALHVVQGLRRLDSGRVLPVRQNDNVVKIGWYRTMNECAGECSSGIKCFGIQCIPEQNPCL
jgi:hypothetical protein